MFRVRVRRRILWRVTALRRCLRSLWNQIFSCACGGRSPKYRQLPSSIATTNTMSSPCSLPTGAGFSSGELGPPCHRQGEEGDSCSDLVSLKISLLGDCQIGKTSFLAKYAGGDNEEGGYQTTGCNRTEKTLCVRGARIGYSIWEAGGDGTCQNNMPDTCKDSVAVLIMFDLTSRCTLNSVIGWYNEARKWNKTAIPILVGTKFDEFVQLPMDLQWTIASQARGYAKALNATLFFSSATYNINVNKIFKFITARLLNLPWTVERNLTIGEPIIDF